MMPLFLIEPVQPEIAGVAGTTLVGAVVALWRQHLADLATTRETVTALHKMSDALDRLTERIDGLGA